MNTLSFLDLHANWRSVLREGAAKARDFKYFLSAPMSEASARFVLSPHAHLMPHLPTPGSYFEAAQIGNGGLPIHRPRRCVVFGHIEDWEPWELPAHP